MTFLGLSQTTIFRYLKVACSRQQLSTKNRCGILASRYALSHGEVFCFFFFNVFEVHVSNSNNFRVLFFLSFLLLCKSEDLVWNNSFINFQDLRELFSLPKLGFDVSPTQQQLQEEHDQQHQMYKLCHQLNFVLPTVINLIVYA